MNKIKILITAYDCRPMLGGIATYVDEVCQQFSTHQNIELRLLAHVSPALANEAKAYDEKQLFKIVRVNMGARPEWAIFSLSRAIRSQEKEWLPDVILNFLWLPEGVASMLGAGSTPYVLIAHGVEVLEGSLTLRKRIRSFFAPIKKRTFQRAQRILTNSHFTQALVEKHCGADPQNIFPVLAGVDPTKFYPAPRPDHLQSRYFLQGKKVILTVTRLVDYKGIDYVIRSLPIVIKTHPDIIYLIGGVGEDEARLKKIAQEYSVDQYVKFIGKIPESELSAHYHLCDVFVMASRDDYFTPNVEGFGLVYLEASSCEKPIVAGKSGGVPDAVENKVSGLLVDPLSTTEIAIALSTLLSDEELCKKLGRQGRQRVLNEFTWKKVSDRILTHILQGLKNST